MGVGKDNLLGPNLQQLFNAESIWDRSILEVKPVGIRIHNAYVEMAAEQLYIKDQNWVVSYLATGSLQLLATPAGVITVGQEAVAKYTARSLPSRSPDSTDQDTRSNRVMSPRVKWSCYHQECLRGQVVRIRRPKCSVTSSEKMSKQDAQAYVRHHSGWLQRVTKTTWPGQIWRFASWAKTVGPSGLSKAKCRRTAMLRSKHANLFLMAELEVMAAMKSKGVLEEIDQSEMPAGGRAIKTMWVYGYETDQHGYIIRVKARLVALGNWQRPGMDFVETFAPVARMSSFRMIIELAAKHNLKVYRGDINTAYLNASLEIPQYVKSIEGFPCAVDGHMYVVRKALYGLGQSRREWNTDLNSWLLDRGFQRCATEPCLYFRYEGDTIALVLVYVDGVVCATNDTQFKSKLFSDLNLAYGLKDQGELSEYLGYDYDAANKCGNPMETKARLVPAGDDESVDSSFDYRGTLGMLMYFATCTRPDLAYALGQLNRFVSKPTTKHVGALKRVLRYLVGTTEYGIRYLRGPADGNVAIVLQGFWDSDWASDSETRKSTSGFVFTLASGAIAWMSRRQPIIALSTAAAEYVAACEASMEATAEGNILTEVLAHHTIKPVIGIDSSAAHIMATSPTYSRRTRHIELRWHYVREQVQRGSIELVKIQGEENPADAFTKPLDKARLNKLCEIMSIMATT
ncbi:unnamed protein product [Phytophthora fragariaefolia]|uniref:Unnamed protein product n=1 Tax=Phytophthora fragariaefolia TaxID=1490495 RepID=A0A9W6U6J7_9STRA|nr:unnamed protein product [Phytophthora fragariaefolia]